MSFERPEGNLYEKFQPAENNMFYAKVGGNVSSQKYISPFLEKGSSLDQGVNEGPSVLPPAPSNNNALSRIQQPRPPYPEQLSQDILRSGHSHTESPHGNPVALNQRAQPPPHAPKIRERPRASVVAQPTSPIPPPDFQNFFPQQQTSPPQTAPPAQQPVVHPHEGCKMCGKRIVSQCSCSSHETVCEGGHCYFVDPRTGRTYGKNYPQSDSRLLTPPQRPPSRRSNPQTDQYGNQITQLN